MRNMFGWDLPPGVTNRMIDEAAGVYDRCNVCGHWLDDCICPECPHCGEVGNEACYDRIFIGTQRMHRPAYYAPYNGDGMTQNWWQAQGRYQAEYSMAEERIAEDKLEAEYAALEDWEDYR